MVIEAKRIREQQYLDGSDSGPDEVGREWLRKVDGEFQHVNERQGDNGMFFECPHTGLILTPDEGGTLKE